MELNPSIERILLNRGISTPEDLEEYLSDKPQTTYDPFLLHDMEEGVDLILSAVDMGKNICIYGDYDADGVTSVALLKGVLDSMGAHTSYYIPSRFDEGYGLNSAALDKIKEAGASLVVTVDCGCTSVSEVEHAKEIGLEILITDHHAMKDEIPDCLLINPKHPDSRYPFRSLAGVGVAFKVAQALVETVGLPKEVLTSNLDLVGIGTIGDVVPLVDENRMLVKYGLRAINVSNRPGLKALIERVGLTQGALKSRDISHVVVPHINAAGRVDNATLAARLMQTKDQDKAVKLADSLAECNINRKNLQQSLLRDCLETLEAEGDIDRKFILLDVEGAHEGIVGIVASNIREKYGVPTMIMTTTPEGEKKGSGRSPDGIDLFSVLNKYPDVFVRFGGHAAACGFTVKPEEVSRLRDILEEEMGVKYEAAPEAFSGKKEPEILIDEDDADFTFTQQQDLMEPFGKDNPKPLIGLKLNVKSYDRIGAEGQFLRVRGVMPKGKDMLCVDFMHPDEDEVIAARSYGGGDTILAVGYLEEREWNGTKSLQFKIEHLEEVPSE